MPAINGVLSQFGMEPWHILVAILIIVLLLLFCPRYRKVPPNQALIISGPIRRHYKVRGDDGDVVSKKFGYRIVRGGATLVIPILERVDTLNLGLMQVDIKTTQPVPSQEYISVMVDGVANIKIGTSDLCIATAAEQFLNWKQADIATIAQQVLEGNMREIIGRMTISDLVQNRDKFATETSAAASSDMSNMGLEIVNLTIQNFSDKDGVVETMSTKNIVEKQRDADVARALAEQEGHKAKTDADAKIAEQNRNLAVKEAEYKAAMDREKAIADAVYTIQQERTRKELEEEKAAAELMRLQKELELQREQVEIERERLNVTVREKAEAELFEAQKQAEAKLFAAQKEAEAIEIRGRAEAEAIRMKAEAMQYYGQAAMLEMVVEKLPDVARAMGEPLAKTDKIILFGEGAATGLTRDVSGSMLQTFEALKASLGLDIPQMLKNVSVGGLVGKNVPPQEGADA